MLPRERLLVERELERFARESVRLALRGQESFTEHLRAVGQGAAAGAVGGAVAGGIASGGVLAAPTALVGGVAGAVGTGGLRLVERLRYNSMADHQKAAWHAGDLQEKLDKLAGHIAKGEPQLASFLKHLAASYKQFIDAAVEKKGGIDITKNRFNLDAEDQVRKFNSERARVMDFISGYANRRTTASTQTPTEDGYFSNLGAEEDYRGSMIADFASAGVAGGFDEAARAALRIPAPSPSAILKITSLPSALGGIITDLGIDAAANWVEKLAGDLKFIQSYAADVTQIIREINLLTDNDPRVRMAGNQVYTYLQQLIKTYQEASGTASSAFDEAQRAIGGAQSADARAPKGPADYSQTATP
jgi:hypothetical protein